MTLAGHGQGHDMLNMLECYSWQVFQSRRWRNTRPLHSPSTSCINGDAITNTLPLPQPSCTTWEANSLVSTRPLHSPPCTTSKASAPRRRHGRAFRTEPRDQPSATTWEAASLTALAQRTATEDGTTVKRDAEATGHNGTAPRLVWSGTVQSGSYRTTVIRPPWRGCRRSTRTLLPALGLRFNGGAEAPPPWGPQAVTPSPRACPPWAGAAEGGDAVVSPEGGRGGWRRGGWR